MSTVLSILAVALITQAVLTAAVFVWLAVGSWLEHRADQRRREQQVREMSLAWIVGLSAHPTAGRIRDRIAANEAARIDGNWPIASREWSA